MYNVDSSTKILIFNIKLFLSMLSNITIKNLIRKLETRPRL
jgi:hypothetical protein